MVRLRVEGLSVGMLLVSVAPEEILLAGSELTIRGLNHHQYYFEVIIFVVQRVPKPYSNY